MFCFPPILGFSPSTFLRLHNSITLTLAQQDDYFFSTGSHAAVTTLCRRSECTFKAFSYPSFSVGTMFLCATVLKSMLLS